MRNLLVWVCLLAAACASVGDPGHNLVTMARPTAYPNWATNATYAGGPDVGGPTKVVPSAGRLADGWHNGDAPPAQEQNYEMDLLNQWVQWHEAGNTIALASLASQTNAVENGKIYVDEVGWYSYHAVPGFTADGLWVVTATGMGAGAWVHQSLVGVHLNMFASVGPTPGDVFTVATTAGRINKAVVPMGMFAYTVNAFNPQYTHTSATITTLGTPIDTNGFSATMRPLLQNDVIEMHATAWIMGNSAAAFVVSAWLEWSADAGATWTAVPRSPSGTVTIALTADNTAKALPLSFFMPYPAYGGAVAGRFMIRLRAQSDGTHQLVINVESDYFKVSRP